MVYSFTIQNNSTNKISSAKIKSQKVKWSVYSKFFQKDTMDIKYFDTRDMYT